MRWHTNPLSADAITRRPWPVLAIALLLSVLSVFAVVRMKPETSLVGLLDRHDPAVRAMDTVLDRFPLVGEMLVLATLPPDAADGPSPLIDFATRLDQSLREDVGSRACVADVRFRPPPQMRTFVERVVVPNGLDYLDDATRAAMLQRLTRAGMDEQLARAKAALAAPGPAGEVARQLAKDPLRLYEFLTARLGRVGVGTGFAGGDAFYSPDRRSLLIRISGKVSPSDLDFCRRITNAVTRVAESTNTSHMRLDIAGAYAVATHSVQAIRRDSIIGVNTSIVGIAVLFLALYRRPIRQFLFAFVPMAMGMLWGFGVYALFHDTFTPLAAVVGGALGGVGIDYFVFSLARARGSNLAGSLRALRRPLLAAWATSVIGFLAIAWSPIGVLRDFAVLGTLALLGAYVSVITLLPAALAAFDRSTDASQRSAIRIGALAAIGRRLARFHRPVVVFATFAWVGLVVFVILGPGSLRPDADLLTLHPQPNPPLEAQRFIAERMGMSPASIQLYLQAAEPTDLLALAHEVERRLDTPAMRSAGFSGSFGLSSLLPDPANMARVRDAGDPALPSRVTRDLDAALTAAGFQPAKFAGYQAFLNRFLTPAPTSVGADALHDYPDVARLVLSQEALDGKPATDALCLAFFDNPLEKRDRRDAALTALHTALDGIDGVTITGMTPVNARIDATIYRDLPKLVAAAVVFIAIALLVHFRSAKLALIAVTPTVVSITVVLAFMKLTQQPLTLVNMIMVPLLMGIDVDYSILTIDAWTRSRNKRELLRAFPVTTSAVVTCVLTTLLGFGTLTLTSIPAIQSLGVLITVGVISCLTASMVVLWPILWLMRTRDASVSR